MVWDPRETVPDYVLLHLLQKFPAEAAVDSVQFIGMTNGADRETTERIAQAVNIAVRTAVTQAFPPPAPTQGRRRRQDSAEAWLWDRLAERLDLIEVLVLKNGFEDRRKKLAAAQRKKKTAKQSTPKNRGKSPAINLRSYDQQATEHLYAFLQRYEHQLSARVYHALMDDLKRGLSTSNAKRNTSQLAGMYVDDFLFDLRDGQCSEIKKVKGLGERGLAELRETLRDAQEVDMYR